MDCSGLDKNSDRKRRNFGLNLSAIEQAYQDREELRITGLPARIARKLSNPLFQPVLPTVAEEGYVDADRILLMSALDASARLADGLHVAKANLMVGKVVRRIERELKIL